MKKFLGGFLLLLLLYSSTSFASSPQNQQLMKAASTGDLVQVSELIAAGANPNYQNAAGLTPLMMSAISPRNFDVSVFLISAGADINARNMVQDTPLIYALMGDNTPLAALLIHQGADADFKGSSGKSARDLASEKDNKDILRILGEPRVTVVSRDTDEKLDKKAEQARKNRAGIFISLPNYGLLNSDSITDPIYQSLSEKLKEAGYTVVPLEDSKMILQNYVGDSFNQPNDSTLEQVDLQKVAKKAKANLIVYIEVQSSNQKVSTSATRDTFQSIITCDVRVFDAAQNKYISQVNSTDVSFILDEKSTETSEDYTNPSVQAFIRAINKAIGQAHLQYLLS